MTKFVVDSNVIDVSGTTPAPFRSTSVSRPLVARLTGLLSARSGHPDLQLLIGSTLDAQIAVPAGLTPFHPQLS